MARRKCQHASRSTRPIRIIRQEGRNGTGTEISLSNPNFLPSVFATLLSFYISLGGFFFQLPPTFVQSKHRSVFCSPLHFGGTLKLPNPIFFPFFCFEYCAPFFLPTFQISFFDLLEACVAAPGPSIFDNVPRVRTGSHATLRAFF